MVVDELIVTVFEDVGELRLQSLEVFRLLAVPAGFEYCHSRSLWYEHIGV